MIIVINGIEKEITEEEYKQLLKDSTKKIVEDSSGNKKLLEKIYG